MESLSDTSIYFGCDCLIFSLIFFYSFSFFSNNYIRGKEELAENWIFVRIFKDKKKKRDWREKMGAFKNDIFTFNLVLIDFFFFLSISYSRTCTCFLDPF